LNSSTGAKRALETPAPKEHPDAFVAAEGLVIALTDDPVSPDSGEPTLDPQPADALAGLTYQDLMQIMRRCVLYGTGGFAVVCILVGAFEALFGR
jgi:hypothetical protein